MSQTIAPGEKRERFGAADRLCVNAIRALAIDAVEQARSGHPGAPLGLAPAAYLLWTRFLRHNPLHPGWPDRDRLVLSAGHASMLLYALLHLCGYALPLDEIKRFRQWGSLTPGHPEHGLTPGVETTTGPLGQGFANAVGMAMAERLLAARCNMPGHAIVGHRTFGICSDGDLMEGISSEAASLAGHLGLGSLILLYDDNGISIDGSTDLAFTEDVPGRFEAYGWQTLEVADGEDLEAIESAVAEAIADEERPSLIVLRTHIGYGSPNKQDTAEVHGAPLGPEEARLTKQALGWPTEPPFLIPGEVRARFAAVVGRGVALESEWRGRLDRYAAEFPEKAGEFLSSLHGALPSGWRASLPTFSPGQGPMATRKASAKVLNAIAPVVPSLVGGSADLTESNGTVLAGEPIFQRKEPGRYIHFGVREHAMGGIMNGLALHGGVRPYGGTFLIFSDYMRPSIRLAALMRLPVVYVFTHDSVGLGEDGPTHQPVEHLASLRALPGLTVIRPSDAAETAIAWRLALERRDGPVALCLTRQDLPILDRARLAPADGLERGAYVLADAPEGRPDVILLASGSEVHVALEARELLAEESVGARVVAMPSWELFAEQPAGYRDEVLPRDVEARLAVEAASPLGWHRWVGDHGDVLGLERFGASAPGKTVLAELGFTTENVARRARALLAYSVP